MGEYFKGWRRKIGVVTLLMACTLMAVWVRSETHFDQFLAYGDKMAFGIAMFGGRFELFRHERIQGSEKPFWRTRELSHFSGFTVDANGVRETFDPMTGYKTDWRWDWSAFHIGSGVSTSNGRRYESCILPFGAIVFPLALISLWLLLVRPRQSTPKKIAEPIAARA